MDSYNNKLKKQNNNNKMDFNNDNTQAAEEGNFTGKDDKGDWQYEGEYQIGDDTGQKKRHGYGTCGWKAIGEKYEGNFKKDKMDGEGKLTKADGTMEEGQWKKGKLKK